MNLDINQAEPQIMFLDLNSAFASAEQQAHPGLRGRPMGVTNRISPHCCVIACSYEAKALGIKTGSRLSEARALCPNFVILESDPPKYHFMYQKLAAIMRSYSPNIAMKSIDEGVIDFSGTRQVNTRPLEDIGREIKQRFKAEVGSHMRLNVGIAPNRFLAKQAANWHKPDGLDRIDHRNLLEYYRQIKLTDLTGIASHFEARLQAAGIFTPEQFLKTPADYLKRFVFHSVIGDDWHQRLRGYEADAVPTKLGSVGRQWVLAKSSRDDDYLLPCFQYLAETTAKKLRYQAKDARGVMVWVRFQAGGGWYQRKMFKNSFYTDRDIYLRALHLFNRRPKHLLVQTMGISLYQLMPSARNQLSLMEQVNQEDWLTTAVDEINERYGTFKIFSANALLGTKIVKQKIPFGSTKYFELLFKQA